MSLPSVYKALYRTVKEREAATGIQLSPDVRMEIMRLYLERIAKPLLSEESNLRFISSMPRPEVAAPRSLTHFTTSERRSRAARSEAVRKALLQRLIYEEETVSLFSQYNEAYASGEHPENQPKYSRQSKCLFRPIPEKDGVERKAVQDYNRMISRLFDDNALNKKTYLAERARISGRTVAEEDALLQQERMQVILERVASCAETLRHLDELTDPTLSPAELAANYDWISDASNVCLEIDKFEETYPFSEKQKRQMDDLKDLQNFCGTALGKLCTIANPSYEYLDAEFMDDYVIYDPVNPNIYSRYKDRALHKDVIEWKKEHEAGVLSDYVETHPELKPFLMDNGTPLNWFRSSKVTDVNEVFLEDYMNIQNNRMLIREDVFQNVKQNLGFDDKDAVCWREASGENGIPSMQPGADIEDLRNNKPIVFEKNNRVVILSPGTIMGKAPNQETPEELFNFTLSTQNTYLKEKLASADPLWIKSSPEFKAMKDSFAAVNALSPLAKGSSLGSAFAACRDLLATSEAYLQAKKDGLTKDEDRSSRERNRVQAARELRAYARTKLRQLELVEAARNTLVRFRGKSPEEQRRMASEEDIIAEDARVFREARSRQHVPSERSSQPFLWMKDQMDAIYKERIIPDRVRNVIINNYMELNTLQKGNLLYGHNTEFTGAKAAYLCGSMIAAELILQEQSRLRTPGIPGAVEEFFTSSNDSKNAMLRLGKQAMVALTGRDYQPVQSEGSKRFSCMTQEQLKEFIETFQPRELAEQFTDRFLNDLGISPTLQQLTGQYVNAVKPIRGNELDAIEQAFITFANEKILAPMESCLKNPATKDPINAAESQKLLANGVIYNLIQLERARPDQTAPGYLETMLAENPNGIQVLSERITGSTDFRNLMQANARVDGTVSVSTMAKMLDQITTPTLVRNTMRSLTASCGKNLGSLTKQLPEQKVEKTGPAKK